MIPLGPEAVRGLYQALRGNEMLVLAADRDLTANGVPVEFFGEVDRTAFRAGGDLHAAATRR